MLPNLHRTVSRRKNWIEAVSLTTIASEGWNEMRTLVVYQTHYTCAKFLTQAIVDIGVQIEYIEAKEKAVEGVGVRAISNESNIVIHPDIHGSCHNDIRFVIQEHGNYR